MEPFAYTKEEVARMFEKFNPLILDSLKEGMVHRNGERGDEAYIRAIAITRCSRRTI